MKQILICTSLLLGLFTTLNLHAEEGNIEEHKTKVTAHIDKRIAMLNELKTCVSAASKKGDIKNCRKTHKEKMGSMKDEHKD